MKAVLRLNPVVRDAEAGTKSRPEQARLKKHITPGGEEKRGRSTWRETTFRYSRTAGSVRSVQLNKACPSHFFLPHPWTTYIATIGDGRRCAPHYLRNTQLAYRASLTSTNPSTER